jgi:septum formation protein
MLVDKLKNHRLILASQSPRRQFLMQELGLNFEVIIKNGSNESYPKKLQAGQIALYLAEKKAKPFLKEIDEKAIVITADTIVWLNNKVINKPKDKEQAIQMLGELSGKKHQVFTGVCIMSAKKKELFSEMTDVYFRKLTAQEIEYYVDAFNPYDKAGAYGAQEWIGYIGIERIEGSYFNVMGLPVQKLYRELFKFVEI